MSSYKELWEQAIKLQTRIVSRVLIIPLEKEWFYHFLKSFFDTTKKHGVALQAVALK